MMNEKIIKTKLKENITVGVEECKRYHKTDEGGYAAQDIFLGITVPDIRKVVKEVYKETDLNVIQNLLKSEFHEERMCALLILVEKMKKANKEEQDSIVKLYLDNTENINGWDLVDLSAPYIIGKYIYTYPENTHILYDLTEATDLWKQRISIVANWFIIRKGEYSHILKIADIHLLSEQDLIRKAVGWMLREVGKRDYNLEYDFLKTRYKKMPRTMLRYSIEKFDEDVRQKFLKGEI